MGGVVQYSGGITSVHARDNISPVGDNISTVEGIQYCGGIHSVLWGYLHYCGGCSVQWGPNASVWWRALGDNISTCGG